MKLGALKVAFVVAVVVLLVAGVGFSIAPRQPDSPAGPVTRFASVEVYVDSGESPLAAYQVEFSGRIGDGVGGGVKLVGIEGGAAGTVFAAPPAYDPKALAGGRVVIADFSTLAGEKLPSGRSLVARLHLMLEIPEGHAGARPEYVVKLIAAGSPDGAHIQASASVVEGDAR